MNAKNRLVKKLMMTPGGLMNSDEEVDTGTAPPRPKIVGGRPGNGNWNPVVVKPGQKKPKNWAR
jgi:hypothetical protein